MAVLVPRKVLGFVGKRLQPLGSSNVLEGVGGGIAPITAGVIGDNGPEMFLGGTIAAAGLGREHIKRSRTYGRDLPAQARDDGDYLQLGADLDHIAALTGDGLVIQLGRPFAEAVGAALPDRRTGILDTAPFNGAPTSSEWNQLNELIVEASEAGIPKVDLVIKLDGVTDILTGATPDGVGTRKLLGKATASKPNLLLAGADVVILTAPNVSKASGIKWYYKLAFARSYRNVSEQQTKDVKSYREIDDSYEFDAETGVESWRLGESTVTVIPTQQVLDRFLDKKEPGTYIDPRKGIRFTEAGLDAVVRVLTDRAAPLLAKRAPRSRRELLLSASEVPDLVADLGDLREPDVTKLTRPADPTRHLVGDPRWAATGRTPFLTPAPRPGGPSGPRGRRPS